MSTSSRPLIRSLSACCLGLVFAALAGSPFLAARAQVRGGNETGVDNVFLPAPREARQRLSQAREALSDQRYADAVDNLDKLLRDPESEDYFSGETGDDKTQRSIKGEALRLLGAMPKRGREVYELSFGAEARRLLDEAVAEGNLTKLVDVTRMFFHTRAGYEATLLLSRYHLDRGRPLAGALCLSRMAEVPAATDEFDPELSLLLAACWYQAGNESKAEETMVGLRARKPRATIRVGDKEERLFEQPGEALAWLKQMIGERQLFAPREVSQWAMFRGDASRNAPSAGSAPLLSYRWRVPTANLPPDEDLVRQAGKKLRDQNWAALPGLHPVVVQDYVVMRTPNRVVGVNFRTGKRVWEYPWTDPSELAARNPALPAGAGNRNAAQRETELSQRLWEDAAYGQLASDGEAVYLLDGLGYAFMNQFGNRIFIGAGGRPMRNPGFAQSFNELVALSLPKEGKALWRVGGEKGEDEPRLAGAFFLGPPLPLHGSLYVLAEINSEIRLVVLSARTGELEWSQQLAHVDNRTILMDVVRRLAGATPSYADGVLVCPTSAGAVVAVDVATRSLLWGYQYEQTRQPANRFGIINAAQNQQRGLGNRWADAAATIAEGTVLLTPVESDNLYCLDLATGKLLWPAQKRVDGGHEHLYVGGVLDGKAVLVGKNKVTAIKLADGAPAWSESVELPGMPSGRGFLSDRHYYVPTTDSKLVKIEVGTGKVAQTTSTGQVLGNLVCYRDQIIAQGVDWLYAFHQNEPLRAAVAKRLEANPDDGEALARQAEILLQDGKPTEAIRLLRRAHKLQVPKEADAIRALLATTLLAALREDFSANQDLVPEIESLVEQPAQRAELRRLMALGLLKTGQNDLAFEAFVKLAGLDDATPPNELVSPLLESIEPGLSVRRDRWVGAQIGRLLLAADAEQRARMEATLAQRLEAVLKTDSPPGLRQFVDYFGAHPLADRARLRLAQKLIEKDGFLEAEFLLTRVEQSPDEPLVQAARQELARLYEKAGVQPKPRASEHAWRSGQAEVKESSDVAGPTSTTRRAAYPIRLRDARGPDTGLFPVYDTSLNSLVFRDGFGRERLQVSLNRSDGSRFYVSNYGVLHGKTNGHLTVVSIGFEIVAIDTLRGEAGSVRDAMLWRQDLSPAVLGAPGVAPNSRMNPSIRAVANPWGELRYIATDPQGRLAGETSSITSHGICFQKLRELHCVDPLTGETLWVRDGLDPGSQLFGDEDRVFVAPPNLNEALVLSAADGSLLGRRKLEPADNRWATLEGRVLSWAQTDNGLLLRLVDLWSEKEIWQRQFSAGSRGCLVGHDEVAVLEPGGAFYLLSLAGEKPIIEARLEPENLLNAVHVLRSDRQYLVAANRPNTAANPDATITAPLGGNVAPLLVGRLYAFDRQTGRPQWQSPAFIDQFGLPLDQPGETPVLTFMRQSAPRRRVAGQPNTTTSAILCLDRRDGRILVSQDNMPQTINQYSVVGDPEKQEVTIQLPTRAFGITFTDRPAPPEPPAQMGEASSQTASTGNLGEKLGGAVLNALGRGLLPGGALPIPGRIAPEQREIDPNDPFAP